jgi:hypothetical protein
MSTIADFPVNDGVRLSHAGLTPQLPLASATAKLALAVARCPLSKIVQCRRVKIRAACLLTKMSSEQTSDDRDFRHATFDQSVKCP